MNVETSMALILLVAHPLGSEDVMFVKKKNQSLRHETMVTCARVSLIVRKVTNNGHV